MWQAIAFLKAVFEPIHSLLRRTDSRVPMMGKFYKLMSDLGGVLDELFEPPSKWSAEPWCNYQESISQIHLDRWNYMHSSYHAAGYALDPAYLADDVTGINDGEVMTGLVQVIERIHYSDEQARATALMQFNEFRSQSGIFGMPASQQYAKQVPAHEYWNMIGGQAGALRKVAMRVLSKVTSSSACERNWSAFEAIQSPKRNRLNSSTLNDLVFTRVNLRLQQARLEDDHASTVQDWMAETLADAEADAQNDVQSLDADDDADVEAVAEADGNDDVVVVVEPSIAVAEQ